MKRYFYINLYIKHCLDIEFTARVSADVIYHIRHISLVCGSGIVIEVRK